MSPEIGDYVLATKYEDGDPGDHFAVGYLKEIIDHYGQRRYIVVDNDGNRYRYNGFRRCEKITDELGRWLIKHFPEMEQTKFWYDDDDQMHGKSVWDWAKEGPKAASEPPLAAAPEEPQ